MGNTRVGMQGIRKEADGTFIITISSFSDDGDIDLVISQDEAVALCSQFQQSFFEPIPYRTVPPVYAHLTVTDASLAEGSVAAVLVQTREMGWIAFSFEPSVAAVLKEEIDRSVASYEARARPKN